MSHPKIKSDAVERFRNRHATEVYGSKAIVETPDPIMKRLRQREGLDATDATQDEQLNSQAPMTKLRNVIAWELGDPSWADQFMTWAKDCGIELVDPR